MTFNYLIVMKRKQQKKMIRIPKKKAKKNPNKRPKRLKLKIPEKNLKKSKNKKMKSIQMSPRIKIKKIKKKLNSKNSLRPAKI